MGKKPAAQKPDLSKNVSTDVPAPSAAPQPPVPPEVALKWQLYGTIVSRIAILLYILASSAPLYALYLCVKELAGKKTDVNLGITIAVSLAGLAALLKTLTSQKKMTSQKDELIRLRERCALLEKQLKKHEE